ncbi:hypothetical protein [Roseivirga pacifica]|uniref:hypothetical protein n=1 Tax=Roseivirga pacifica TaxID=1267423 RepID=UPI003BB02121
MKSKNILFLISVIVQITIIVALATAPAWFSQPVVGNAGMPWGNLLTWVLLTLFPSNFLLVRRSSQTGTVPQKFYYGCAYLGFAQGLFWGIVTYMLAGNWAGNFVNDPESTEIWELYTYVTALLPFIGYFGMRLLMIFFKKG